MKKLIIASVVLLFLSGCATTRPCEPIVQIKEVPKIVYKNPPSPPEINKPDLPLYSLDEDSDPDKIAKAYVATVELLRDYAKKLEIALDAYRSEDDDDINN